MQDASPAIDMPTACDLGYKERELNLLKALCTFDSRTQVIMLYLPAVGGYRQIGHDGTSFPESL